MTSKERIRVFIIDDSTYDRSRSKNLELLAKVKDHTTGKFVRGFRMLTLGWSDGHSFVPVDFALLSSAKPENRYCEMRIPWISVHMVISVEWKLRNPVPSPSLS